MLDTDMGDLIDSVRPWITDCVWLGIMNSPFARLGINGAPENVMEAAAKLVAFYDSVAVKALYNRYKDDPMIKWKESIKKIVGLEIPTEKGLDVCWIKQNPATRPINFLKGYYGF